MPFPVGGVPGRGKTGRSPGNGGAPGAVKWLLEALDPLYALYGVPVDLGDFHVDPARVPELARRSSGSSMSGNPRELSQEERERIIRSLLPGSA